MGWQSKRYKTCQCFWYLKGSKLGTLIGIWQRIIPFRGTIVYRIHWLAYKCNKNNNLHDTKWKTHPSIRCIINVTWLGVNCCYSNVYQFKFLFAQIISVHKRISEKDFSQLDWWYILIVFWNGCWFWTYFTYKKLLIWTECSLVSCLIATLKANIFLFFPI